MVYIKLNKHLEMEFIKFIDSLVKRFALSVSR